MNLNVLLQQALHDFHSGKLGEAKKKFKKIASHAPNHVGTLNYLSLIYTHEKRYPEAEKLFQKILQIDQTSAQTYYNYSLVLKFMNKFTSAFSVLEKAIQLGGYSEEFGLHKASLQSALGDKEAALKTYDQILANNPHSTHGWHGKGKILLEFYNFTDAQKSFERSIAINEKFYDGWIGLAEALFSQDKYKEALFCFQHTLSTSDNPYFSYKGMAKAYAKLGNMDASLQNYKDAFAINQTDEEIFSLFAADMVQFKKIEEAITLIQSLKRKFSTSSDLYASLGYIYLNNADYDLSKKELAKALQINPKNSYALTNMGSLHLNMGDTEASLQFYKKALSCVDKNEFLKSNEVKFFMSFIYFASGDLPTAYSYYDAGSNPLLTQPYFRHPQRQFSCPRWQGQNLENKTLLIWKEQGLGDQFHFMACIPEVLKICDSIIIEVEERMIEVIQRSFPTTRVRKECYNSNAGNFSTETDFDYHIPMGSLMRHTRPTIESYKNSHPYIVTNPNSKAKFKERLRQYQDNLLVGLWWRSGMIDKVRSMHYFEIKEFEPLFQLGNVTFVNLQYSDTAEELLFVKNQFGVEILQWDDLDLKNDLDDIFALMSELDLIITTPTAVRSMGGAVGTKVLTFAKNKNWINFNLDYDPWFENSSEIPFYQMTEKEAFASAKHVINTLWEQKK